MRVSCYTAAAIIILRLCSAQTYTQCNPLQESCPPNPALGGSIKVDFTTGPSEEMKRGGSATLVYDKNDGAQFSVAATGQNPTLQSKRYIMFGKVEVVARAAPGAGIVSSIVLQSDDLDEVDIEFVGNDGSNVQSNYFSKGDTSTYDRGLYHSVSGDPVTAEFHTYTIEWTADYIKWYVDGRLVRTLRSSDRPEIYPQSPMTVRLGVWAAGDPTMNEHGTVQWAGGPVDYSRGPFVFSVKTVRIEDYSTGSSYEYTDSSGSWPSIKAHDGQVGAAGPNSSHLLATLLRLSAKRP